MFTGQIKWKLCYKFNVYMAVKIEIMLQVSCLHGS